MKRLIDRFIVIGFYSNVDRGSGYLKAAGIWAPSYPSEMVVLSPEGKPLYSLQGSLSAAQAAPILEAALKDMAAAKGGQPAAEPKPKAEKPSAVDPDRARRADAFRKALESALGKEKDPAFVQGILEQIPGSQIEAMKGIRARLWTIYPKSEACHIAPPLYELMDAVDPRVVDARKAPGK